jgi:hypothetical protein
VFWGHTMRTDSDPNPPLALYGVRPLVRSVSDSAYDWVPLRSAELNQRKRTDVKCSGLSIPC